MAGLVHPGVEKVADRPRLVLVLRWTRNQIAEPFMVSENCKSLSLRSLSCSSEAGRGIEHDATDGRPFELSGQQSPHCPFGPFSGETREVGLHRVMQLRRRPALERRRAVVDDRVRRIDGDGNSHLSIRAFDCQGPLRQINRPVVVPIRVVVGNERRLVDGRANVYFQLQVAEGFGDAAAGEAALPTAGLGECDHGGMGEL